MNLQKQDGRHQVLWYASEQPLFFKPEVCFREKAEFSCLQELQFRFLLGSHCMNGREFEAMQEA